MGREAATRVLIKRGADLESKDRDGRTLLLWAAKNGHKAVVQLLIENDVEADGRDHQKGERTPLSSAAENGHADVVQLLLKSRSEVDGKCRSLNDDLTPLSWAARKGHKDTVKLLINAGARANYNGPTHRTPLSYAAERGHDDVVTLLLDWKLILESIDVFLYPLLGYQRRTMEQIIEYLQNPDGSQQKRRIASMF